MSEERNGYVPTASRLTPLPNALADAVIPCPDPAARYELAGRDLLAFAEDVLERFEALQATNFHPALAALVASRRALAQLAKEHALPRPPRRRAGELPYRCSHCDASYLSAETRDDHARSLHGGVTL